MNIKKIFKEYPVTVIMCMLQLMYILIAYTWGLPIKGSLPSKLLQVCLSFAFGCAIEKYYRLKSVFLFIVIYIFTFLLTIFSHITVCGIELVYSLWGVSIGIICEGYNYIKKLAIFNFIVVAISFVICFLYGFNLNIICFIMGVFLQQICEIVKKKF